METTAVRLWPAYQSFFESRRWVWQLPPWHSLTHTNTVHTGTLSVFLPALCVFISRSLTLSHTSTDPQVMTSHLDNKKIEGERERDHGMGQDGSFILLMQRLSEQSLFTKGIQVCFLLLNASAVFTTSLKQLPIAHQLPLVHPEVGLKRASCAKSQTKAFWFSCNPPHPAAADPMV